MRYTHSSRHGEHSCEIYVEEKIRNLYIQFHITKLYTTSHVFINCGLYK